MTRYAFFAKGFGGEELDPQAIGEQLESLIERHGEHLTAEEIVADARKRESPAHDFFTWNENDAADKQRRNEAKRLVKSLRLDNGKGKHKTQAFVYVKHPTFGGKRVILTMRSAMGRPEFREQVVERALTQLLRWSKYYGSHVAMKPFSRDIEKLRDKLQAELMAAV